MLDAGLSGRIKPDPAIYLRLLDRLEVPASACIFLDDIGRNLSTARRLGMETIKVVDVDQALAELGELVDVEGL